MKKICTKCGTEKSLKEFDLEPRGLQGRRADYKQCRAAARIERRIHPSEPKPVPLPGHKFCTDCGLEKPFKEFHRHPRGLFGYDPQCKVCKSAYNARRRQQPGYKEHDRDVHRNNKAYYAAHYMETKDTHLARGQAWRKANPEKARAIQLRRKAHKLQAPVDPVDYRAILERDGYTCYICGRLIDPCAPSRTSAGLTFDHQIPLQPRPGEPQGSHTEDNIHPAHHACNVRKSNIPFDQLTPWQRRGV